MKKIIIFLLMLFVVNLSGYGKVKVVTSYRYIADIAQQIGGDAVSVKALAKGDRNPHFITPRPSFIAKLRQADLLIINGGQLEIGWLPPVVQRANNPDIQPGKKGLLSLIDYVKPIQVPQNVSRAHGDIHPEGNPHFHLDPYNIPVIAEAVMEKLCLLSPEYSEKFRQNYETFNSRWKEKTLTWDRVFNRFREVKIVEYHKLYDYLLHRYHIESEGALEPLPGIPPTSKHIAGIIEMVKRQGVRYIFQDVYNNSKTAKYVSQKTGAKVVVIPHDVGAVKDASDIFALFDVITERLAAND
jgi:zinc/manganese transport system substrate-binding protein